MLDVTKKISNLLQNIAHVELAGSEAELVLPSIYIEHVSNNAAVSMDKKDFLTEFTYQIDVYAETPQRCIEIAEYVDEAMQNEGWQRSNGALIERQRYTLTYRAVVAENFNIYTEE